MKKSLKCKGLKMQQVSVYSFVSSGGNLEVDSLWKRVGDNWRATRFVYVSRCKQERMLGIIGALRLTGTRGDKRKEEGKHRGELCDSRERSRGDVRTCKANISFSSITLNVQPVYQLRFGQFSPLGQLDSILPGTEEYINERGVLNCTKYAARRVLSFVYCS